MTDERGQSVTHVQFMHQVETELDTGTCGSEAEVDIVLLHVIFRIRVTCLLGLQRLESAGCQGT